MTPKSIGRVGGLLPYLALAAAVALVYHSTFDVPFVFDDSSIKHNEQVHVSSLGEALSIPVVVPIWDRGVVPEPMDQFMGVLGAATGGTPLLGDADLILMVGARCDYRLGFLQPPRVREQALIVRIDADQEQLGQGIGAHVSVLGNPRTVLNRLAHAMSQQER